MPCLFQAVVFSEGELFLDNCDFSRSNASQLVFADPESTVVIRNTVLGDMNCEPLQINLESLCFNYFPCHRAR